MDFGVLKFHISGNCLCLVVEFFAPFSQKKKGIKIISIDEQCKMYFNSNCYGANLVIDLKNARLNKFWKCCFVQIFFLKVLLVLIIASRVGTRTAPGYSNLLPNPRQKLWNISCIAKANIKYAASDLSADTCSSGYFELKQVKEKRK